MASDGLQGHPEPTPSSGRRRLIRACALDPGGTTGYAICDIDKVAENIHKVSIGWDQAKLNESELMEFLEFVRADIIICEDFEYRNKARAGLDLTPPRLIGVVKLYSQGNCKLELQKANVGKGHYSDTRLRTFNLYIRRKPHGRDALRHLLHWLTFKGGYGFINMLGVDIDVLDIDVLLNRSLGTDST